MGNIIDIRDYSDDAIEQTIDKLLHETSDIQQLLDSLGTLSETQKRKIIKVLRERAQSTSPHDDEFPFTELDSELVRQAHREKRKHQNDDEKLKKQRRNQALKQLKKFFTVKSLDENLDDVKQTSSMGLEHSSHASRTPTHPILNKDNNQFFGKEDTEMNANPVQNQDTEEYNDKRPVHAPVHQPTAKPNFTPNTPAPNPNPF